MYLTMTPALANETRSAIVPGGFPDLVAAAAIPIRAQFLKEYARVALRWLWKGFLQLMGDIKSLITRFLCAVQSYFSGLKPLINAVLNRLVSFSLDWPSYTFNLAAYTIKTYPHIIHVTAWLIFLGPLAMLCPLLMFYEAAIAIAFNAIFIFHGLVPGTLDKNYLELREATDDAKQWAFVYIDEATNKYNKWTMESNPLLVFRVLSGVTGLYILCSVWVL